MGETQVGSSKGRRRLLLELLYWGMSWRVCVTYVTYTPPLPPTRVLQHTLLLGNFFAFYIKYLVFVEQILLQAN